MAQATQSTVVTPHAFVKSIHGVRYQVKDVARAVAFYTQHLGFTVEHQQLPAFASISIGDATILLSGPGASGSRPMPNGDAQQPGGWNRVVLKVVNLPGYSPCPYPLFNGSGPRSAAASAPLIIS